MSTKSRTSATDMPLRRRAHNQANVRAEWLVVRPPSVGVAWRRGQKSLAQLPPPRVRDAVDAVGGGADPDAGIVGDGRVVDRRRWSEVPRKPCVRSIGAGTRPVPRTAQTTLSLMTPRYFGRP